MQYALVSGWALTPQSTIIGSIEYFHFLIFHYSMTWFFSHIISYFLWQVLRAMIFLWLLTVPSCFHNSSKCSATWSVSKCVLFTITSPALGFIVYILFWLHSKEEHLKVCIQLPLILNTAPYIFIQLYF